MSDLDRLSAEFRGLARAHRAEVVRGEALWSEAIPRVTRHALDVRARATQHGMRPRQFREIAGLWRAIPAAGRLVFELDCTPRRLIINDVRMATMEHRGSDWQDPGEEPALLIVRHGLALVNGRHPLAATTPLASIGSPAIAMFWRRAIRATGGLLTECLTEIALSADRLIAAGGDVRLSNAGGEWLGHVAMVAYNSTTLFPAVCIRTVE